MVKLGDTVYVNQAEGTTGTVIAQAAPYPGGAGEDEWFVNFSGNHVRYPAIALTVVAEAAVPAEAAVKEVPGAGLTVNIPPGFPVINGEVASDVPVAALTVDEAVAAGLLTMANETPEADEQPAPMTDKSDEETQAE